MYRRITHVSPGQTPLWLGLFSIRGTIFAHYNLRDLPAWFGGWMGKPNVAHGGGMALCVLFLYQSQTERKL